MSDLGIYQGEWGNLIFGEGTPYVLNGPLAELLAYETIRADLPIPQGDGAMVLTDHLAAQDLVLSFAVYDTTAAAAEARLAEVLLAFKRTNGVEDWLRFRTASKVWRVRCRPVRVTAPFGFVQARTHIFQVSVVMAQADPRLYGDELRTVQALVYDPANVSGGYILAADLPLNVTANEGVGGETIVTMNGSDIAYPTLVVTNTGVVALDGFALLNVTTGQTFEVTTTIAAGQTLTGDMDALVRAAPGPHIHIGGATRYTAWQQPRIPWGLVTGANRLRFTLQGTAAAADIDARLYWRDASA